MASENAAEFEAEAEFHRQSAQKVDPGMQALANRLASLTGRDHWPTGTSTADQACGFLATLSSEDYDYASEWIDRAIGASDISRENQDLWDDCLVEMTDWLQSLGTSDFDTLEKALSLVSEFGRWSQSITESDVLGWNEETQDAVAQWADDVVATNEAGGHLTDNGGTLLNLPEVLREFFTLDAESIPETAPATPDAIKAETPEEAKTRIEGMIPTALKMLRDSESIAESRKKAHDAAKKSVEAMQDQLNQLVTELSEALTGCAGGEYQLRMPFDRASDSVATASPESAAKSGIATDLAANSGAQEKVDSAPAAPTVGLVAADPIAGESVAVLVADQLSQRTNGKSDGVGIPQGTVDLLVDASLGTIGLLEEHMRKRGDFWAKDVKGIGPGKADKITAALGVLRACFPQPAIDTEPLEELILDQAAYQLGVVAKRGGGPRALINGWSATGHQGRSWLKGYDDQAKTEELTAGATPAANTEGGE